MKITKKQLKNIIRESLSAEEEFENAGVRGREMAKIKHQFDRAFARMRGFDAAPSDIADMEEVRDIYYSDYRKGRASVYLKRLVSGLDTIIREQIPHDVYYFVFPELREAKSSVNSLNEIDYNSPVAVAREHIFQAAQALSSVKGAERMEMREVDILIDQLLEALNRRL